MTRRPAGELLASLRAAIARAEVVPYYQPIVDMRSGKLLRFEALARWPGSRGDIQPSRFIPIAERSGLIGPLFISMLERSLLDVTVWRRTSPDLRVALNLSARGLARARDRIRFALAEAGAAGDWLAVELTETTVMEDVALARQEIERMRSLGVRVEIDDFGTGYSSLRYLQLLSVDAVKIDRQFVEAAVRDRTSEKIVRAVIGLCHELGLETVAEGVAERDVWELLAALGCDSAQGYLVAPATPAAEVPQWVTSWAARREALASASPPRPTAPVRSGSGPRVLVVDDEPGILAIVRDVLKDEGYRVETASNGLEALLSVNERPPQLILLDVHMPILDGEGLVKALRERGIDLPVIVMTAGPAADVWAKKLGALGSMPKPFGIAQLLDVTRRSLAVPAGH